MTGRSEKLRHSRAIFIACNGPQDDTAGSALAHACGGGGHQDVRSLRLGRVPDGTCWTSGDGWWLSPET